MTSKKDVPEKESFELRAATRDDLPVLVAMLADDSLGSQREEAAREVGEEYLRAFEAIDADPNHDLLLLVQGGQILAMLQLSFLPNLTYQGGLRAQIEGVRVASSARGLGLGQRLMGAAIARARGRGARLVQLTTDKRRPDALRFYESLGFVSSHEGMKLHL